MKCARDTKFNSHDIAPYLLVLLQGLLYGFGDPISKVAYDAVGVYSLLTVRYLIAVVFLMLFFAKPIIRGLRESSPADWLIPSVCIAGAYITGNIALNLTAATSVAFLRSLTTVFTPLLASVLFRKKYSLRHIPLLAAVMTGMYLLCGRGGLGSFGAGEVWSLVSALLLACSLVFGEKSLEKTDPMTLTAVQCTMSAIGAFICAIVFEGGVVMDNADALVWGIITYLAIMCTFFGYYLQNRAMRKISSSTVSLLQCFCPVMTAFFSLIILGEHLNPAGVCGCIMILVCVIIETLISE